MSILTKMRLSRLSCHISARRRRNLRNAVLRSQLEGSDVHAEIVVRVLELARTEWDVRLSEDVLAEQYHQALVALYAEIAPQVVVRGYLGDGSLLDRAYEDVQIAALRLAAVSWMNPMTVETLAALDAANKQLTTALITYAQHATTHH